MLRPYPRVWRLLVLTATFVLPPERGPAMPAYTLLVNGRRRSVDVAANTPLLWVLRDNLGLTGTKFGCGIAQCGACTVHVDGEAVRSCVMPGASVQGRAVTTIERLSANGRHTVARAWIEEDVVQCGDCQPWQIMAEPGALAVKPHP